MGNKQTFQQMVSGQLDSHMKKNEFVYYLMPYTKIKSKWIRNLSVRDKILQ
jgi:hypothetical protein